jgi:hypothetical protein
MELVLE